MALQLPQILKCLNVNLCAQTADGKCAGIRDPATGRVFPVYEVIEAEGVTLRSAPSETASIIRVITVGTQMFRTDNVLYPDTNGVPNPLGPQSFFRVRMSANPLLDGFVASQRLVLSTATVVPFLAQTPDALATQCTLEKCCKKTQKKKKEEETCHNESSGSTLLCKCQEETTSESDSGTETECKKKKKIKKHKKKIDSYYY
jgi:hypothetical protein